MITIEIQQRLKARGVRNANELGKLLGIGPGVASRYWNNRLDAIDVRNDGILNKLCAHFELLPGDFIGYHREDQSR